MAKKTKLFYLVTETTCYKKYPIRAENVNQAEEKGRHILNKSRKALEVSWKFSHLGEERPVCLENHQEEEIISLE